MESSHTGKVLEYRVGTIDRVEKEGTIETSRRRRGQVSRWSAHSALAAMGRRPFRGSIRVSFQSISRESLSKRVFPHESLLGQTARKSHRAVSRVSSRKVPPFTSLDRFDQPHVSISVSVSILRHYGTFQGNLRGLLTVPQKK